MPASVTGTVIPVGTVYVLVPMTTMPELDIMVTPSSRVVVKGEITPTSIVDEVVPVASVAIPEVVGPKVFTTMAGMEIHPM